MDLVWLGKLLERGMEVKLKTIDAKISPQNRVLLCTPPIDKTQCFEVNSKAACIATPYSAG